MGRFFLLLMLFTGAMLGVVLSENLLLMFVFWELTSISSFLLIGYHGTQRGRARGRAHGARGHRRWRARAARGRAAARPHRRQLRARRGARFGRGGQGAARCICRILALVLLGAFTKSAQFPFHFWLPGAMAAPTPVSAYLHSATMVKAGVFLLARLYPVLSGTGCLVLYRHRGGRADVHVRRLPGDLPHDLKSLLAYSTMSHLGLIVLLLGIGTPLGAVAACSTSSITRRSRPRCSWPRASSTTRPAHATCAASMACGKYMPITGDARAGGGGGDGGRAAAERVPVQGDVLRRGARPAGAAAACSGSSRSPRPWRGVFSVAYSLRFIHDVFFNGRARWIVHEDPARAAALDARAGRGAGRCVPGGGPRPWAGHDADSHGGRAGDAGGAGAGLQPRHLARVQSTARDERSRNGDRGGALFLAAARLQSASTGGRRFERPAPVRLARRGFGRPFATPRGRRCERFPAAVSRLLLLATLLAGILPFMRHGYQPGTVPSPPTHGGAAVIWLLLVASAMATWCSTASGWWRSSCSGSSASLRRWSSSGFRHPISP